MNINDQIDKIVLVILFLGLAGIVLTGRVDHDTAEWFKAAGSGVLGALLALITGPKRKDSTQ